MEEYKNSITKSNDYFLVLSTYKSKHGNYSYGQSKLFDYFGSVKLLILVILLLVSFYIDIRVVTHFQRGGITVPNFTIFIDYPVVSFISLLLLKGTPVVVTLLLLVGGYTKNIKIIEYVLKFIKGFLYVVHKLVYIVSGSGVLYTLYILIGVIIDKFKGERIGYNIMLSLAAAMLIVFFTIMIILFLRTLRGVIDDLIVNATSTVDDEYAKVPKSNDLSTYLIVVSAFTLIYYTMSLMVMENITYLMNLPYMIRMMYGIHFIINVVILIYTSFYVGGFATFLKQRKH